MTQLITNQNKNFQAQTDSLFVKWAKEYKDNGFNGFCEDGLMYRGKIQTTDGADGKVYWYRDSDNENELWANAPKRVMFLNKDPNANANQDTREWIFRQHETDITALIYKNTALWLFGLLKVDENGIAPDFETITTIDYSSFIDNTPIAYVNCKKESGTSSIKNDTLAHHIETYKGFLKDQILILDPDIIVCGGGSSVIKNFVTSNVYLNTIQVNTWMFYCKENNKLIIDSFHPSYHWMLSKDIYNRMMEKYKDFLEAYPKFRNTCRIGSIE
jgi:hypothetical protein